MATNQNHRRIAPGRSISWLVRVVFIGVLTIFFLFPLYWMVSGSLKSGPGLNRMPPEWWPAEPQLGSYIRLFTSFPTFQWTLNSLIVAGCATVFAIAFGSMAGYALARHRTKATSVVFVVLIVLMIMPREVTLVPLYLLMHQLGLVNTYVGLVLPIVAIPYATFLFRQFMIGLPEEVFDAALVDGGTAWTRYWRIALPLSVPAIGVVGLLVFVMAWNDYMWQLVMVNKESMLTLPVAISTITTARTIDYGLAMAAASYATLPMLILFLGFQRSFMKGLTMGVGK